MFQSLVYKIQLELALQLGNSEQHSSQRAFLGSISGCAGAGVSVCAFVFAFILLGYGKCKIRFDFSQVLLKSRRSCKVHPAKYMRVTC